MKLRVLVVTIIAFVGFLADGQAAQAFAVTECRCDQLPVGDNPELTGNEIIDIVCPGGELAEGASYVFSLDEVAVSIENPPVSYSVFADPRAFFCRITAGDEQQSLRPFEPEYELCRQSLIRRCGLELIRPVPTVSEWGLIATAAVLGIVGLMVMRRRRVAGC